MDPPDRTGLTGPHMRAQLPFCLDNCCLTKQHGLLDERGSPKSWPEQHNEYPPPPAAAADAHRKTKKHIVLDQRH
jgi:hypothetical protein